MSIKDRVVITDNKCHLCAHSEQGELFTLCMHEGSVYHVEQRVEHHTVNHMRTDGPCGVSAIFWKAK